MADSQFLGLVKDLERLIGVPLDLHDNESIRFEFDSGIVVTLQPDERGNVIFDANTGRVHAGDRETDIARILLLNNYRARTGSGFFASVGKGARIFLSQVLPLAPLDAKKLEALMEAAIDEVTALREAIDGLAATPAQSLTASEEMLRTQTLFIKA